MGDRPEWADEWYWPFLSPHDPATVLESWWARYKADCIVGYNAGRLAAELRRQNSDPPIGLRAAYMIGVNAVNEKARGMEKAQTAPDNMQKELVNVRGGDVGGTDSWTGKWRRAYKSMRVRRSRRVAPAPSAGTAAPAASEATGACLKQAGALNE